MIFNRHWMALCFAGGCICGFAMGQEPSTSPSDTSSSTTNESASTPAPRPESGTGASSAFGTPAGGSETPETPATGGEAPGPSSAFGPEGGGVPKEAPPSYTIPGFYGLPGTTLTGGEGRLARPRFRFGVSMAQGYDDNIFQSPSDPQEIPDLVVVVDPGTPDTVEFVQETRIVGYRTRFFGGILKVVPITETRLVPKIIPGRDPVTQTIKFPQYPDRKGSLVSRAGFNADMQLFTRRSLFTADLQGNVDHYWDRPGPSGADDFSGALTLAYLYSLTPRLQASATANVAYISQPDFTRINTPERLGASDIVNALGRLNLAYRVTPRLTVTASASQNAVIYTEKSSNPLDVAGTAAVNGDNFETTFGVEGRYLWNPRYTLLAEYRRSFIAYPDASFLDATTDYILIGGELHFTSRLTATLRLGQTLRTFDESGSGNSSFYGEGSVSYRLGPTSALQWNSRYGFEPPASADSELLAYRTSLTYLRSFTPRLSLSASVAGFYSRVTYDTEQADQSDTNLSLSLSLDYRMSRHLTLNANLTYYKTFSSNSNLDYDRSRLFIGGEYAF